MSDLKGLDALLSELKKLPESAKKDLAREVEFSAREIAKQAQIFAPKDTGYLTGSIKPEQSKDPLTWSVTAYANYAAYMEFGTGGLVQVPSELKEIAIQYKGKGIREVNLRPQPYLYPALQIKGKEFIKRVERLVEKLKL